MPWLKSSVFAVFSRQLHCINTGGFKPPSKLYWDSSGLAYILFGQKNITIIGNYWCGRPHVYLLDFEGQKNTAKDNLDAHGKNFGYILGRHAKVSSDVALQYLPKDMRVFDDYSALISQTASLWVWSKNGKESQKEYADANRGHLIYEQQATIEMLEYGYMLHKALLARIEKASKIEEIYDLRWSINNLKANISEATSFGEIRDLLHFGWDVLGVNNIQSSIAEALSIKEEQASSREGAMNERISRWLTVVFGVITVPSLAKEVLEPVWTLLNWWSPSNNAEKSLFFISIALIIVIVSVILIARSWKINS